MNGSCYNEELNCMTQQNAHSQCTSKNARLVDVTSEEESRFIQERIDDSLVWLDLIRSGSGKFSPCCFCFFFSFFFRMMEDFDLFKACN